MEEDLMETRWQYSSCLIFISFPLLKPTHWTKITFHTLLYSHSIFFIFQPHKSKLLLQPLSNRVTAWQWRRNLKEWLYVLVKSHMDLDTGYNHKHRARTWCQVKRLLAQCQLEAMGLCSGLLLSSPPAKRTVEFCSVRLSPWTILYLKHLTSLNSARPSQHTQRISCNWPGQVGLIPYYNINKSHFILWHNGCMFSDF